MTHKSILDYCRAKAAARKQGPLPASTTKIWDDFAPVEPPRLRATYGTISERGRISDRVLGAMRQGELAGFLGALARVSAGCGYDQWFELGAAIHDFDPLDSGLAVFKAWSRSAEGYRTDEAQLACEAKWREYGREKVAGQRLITKATVYALANQAAPLQNKQESAAVGAPHEGVNGVAALPSVFTDDGSGSVKEGSSDPLIRLNEKYAAIGDVGGKCLILGWVPSKIDEAVTIPSFQSFKAFSERYAHKYVPIKKIGPKGQAVLDDSGREVMEPKQLGSHWLKWTGRRSFEGIDLTPNGPAMLPGGILNLWNGFAVQAAVPASGGRAGENGQSFGAGWRRMHDHIVHVLASGDTESADYVVKFAAWAVQNPGERAEAALVFRGEKGTGKGTFANALRRIFGQHGLQIFNSKHLVGQFNAHLRNCLLLFSDEAFWAGDKQGESVLKGMLTEPTLMIEQKGVDATAWRNRLHVIMSANAEWVVPTSHDERRYTVLDVSNKCRGDEAYFAELYRELNDGGLGAMLWDLLHLDLKGWHPRKIVRTEALRQQKIRSMGPLDEWWEGVLQLGVFPISPMLVKGREVVPAMGLLHAARDTTPRLNTVSAQGFGRFMKSLKNEGYHSSGGNHWEFLELKQARELFEHKWGKWQWEEPKSSWTKKRADNPS